MQNNLIEALIGAVVLVVAAGFMVFASSRVDLGQGGGDLTLTVGFNDAAGLAAGADVRMSGVRIGSVSELSLDPASYRAAATLTIDRDVAVPEDSLAIIRSAGLLGEPYLAIEPGSAPDTLGDGDSLGLGQSSPDLIQLLGQAIFSMSGGAQSDAGQTPAAVPTP